MMQESVPRDIDRANRLKPYFPDCACIEMNELYR